MKSNLLSVDSLNAGLSEFNLIVLFTSMADISTGLAEALPAKLIPNSLFFDFENVFCDRTSGYPHTMPNQALFEHEARKLGINADSKLVVYDSKGLYSAARVWWMFKAMGHKDVVVLDGGLPAWLNAQYPVSDRLGLPGNSGNFTAHYVEGLMVDSDWVLGHLHQCSVIDARSSARFYGTAPEPRAGLRSGHIPGSYNLPFNDCIDSGKLKSETELKKLFNAFNLNPAQPLVFSCGSGVTACILALAANEAGFVNLSVYDGSWSEWGAKPDLPIECFKLDP